MRKQLIVWATVILTIALTVPLVSGTQPLPKKTSVSSAPPAESGTPTAKMVPVRADATVAATAAPNTPASPPKTLVVHPSGDTPNVVYVPPPEPPRYEITPEHLRLHELVRQRKELEMKGEDVSYLDVEIAGIIREIRGERELDQGDDACPGTAIGSSTCLPYTDTGTTVGMVNNYTPSCASSNAPDVVYRFNPPGTGQHTISLCGSGFDTILEIRTGGNCPGSQLVACNDDACGLQSQITATLTYGELYYIIIDGYGSNSGSYTLTITGPRQHGDDCANAVPAVIPESWASSTCNFCSDYDYACPWSSTSPDAVFSYTPPTNQSVTISLCRSSYDTKLYVYQNSCTGTPIACSDDEGTCPCSTGPYRSIIECLPLSPGNTYYMVVDGYGGACGPFFLDFALCPTCNVTAQPGDILEAYESCTYYADGINNGCWVTPRQWGTIQNGQTIFGSAWAHFSHDVDMYLFSLTETDCVFVTIEAEFALEFGLEDTSNCQLPLSYYASYPTPCAGAQTVCFIVPAGTYALYVSPFWNEPRPANTPIPRDYRAGLRWVPLGPPNDNCANAVPLTVNSPTRTCGTTIGATQDCASYPDVWYRFSLSSTSDVTIEFCGSNAPGTIVSHTLYTGPCCAGTQYESPYWEYVTCPDGYVTFHYSLPAGHYWYPLAFSDPSNFCIRVLASTAPPVNDVCANALPLLPNAPTGGSTLLATLDNVPACFEPITSPGVWFRINGTGNTMEVSLCNYYTMWDTRMSLFGCSCSQPACLVANDDYPQCLNNAYASQFTFCTRANEVYYLLVHGYASAVGTFRLHLMDYGTSCSPAVACYDQLLNAPGQVTGNTVGLRNDCGMQASEDAIIKVEIPTGGWWRFSLCGSSFDTRLYIDTMRCGSTWSNDNYCGLQSELCLSVAPRTLWATIESNGAGGNYVFTVDEIGAPIPPANVQATDTLCNGIRITWQDTPNEYGYRIFRNDSLTGLIGEVGQNVTTYFDSLVSAGGYRYYVRSYNSCASSYASVPDSGRRLTLPATVTGVNASDTYCDRITVTWNDVAFETGYNVYRNGQLTGTTNANVLIYNDYPSPGLYAYTVAARNPCGTGPQSSPDNGRRIASVTTAPTLTSPANGTVVVIGQPLQFCGTSVPEALNYSYWWDDDPAFGSPWTANSDSICQTLALGPPLGIWYWKMRGENTCGSGPWSSTRTVEVVTLAAPVLVVRVDGTQLHLHWNRIAYANTYEVQSSSSSESGFAPLTTTPDTTIATSYSGADRRFYRVIAVR